jgi:hypothetical protein
MASMHADAGSNWHRQSILSCIDEHLQIRPIESRVLLKLKAWMEKKLKMAHVCMHAHKSLLIQQRELPISITKQQQHGSSTR